MTILDFMSSLKGCKFASLVYIADVKMSTKSGLKDRVKKMVILQCQLNYSYQNAVNNRLESKGIEGDFVAESLPWGEWKMPNKVITHKGNDYLRFYTYKGSDIKVVYFLDGNVTNEEETALIKANLPKKSESKRQSDAGLTDHQVMPKNVAISNILSFTCDNTTIVNKNAVKFAL